MIQIFLCKHENIDMMCKIYSVYLDELSTWLALNKLALNIQKSALNILVIYIDYQIIWKDHIASNVS